MASVPRIDRPCPLGIDEQRRINGWCTHCRSTVVCLDGLDSAGRRDLLAAASGPICVSYRRSSVAIAAAAVLLGAAATPPAMAGEALAKSSGDGIVPVESVESIPSDDGDQVLLMGGITEPQSAEWHDDEATDLPELPVVVE